MGGRPVTHYIALVQVVGCGHRHRSPEAAARCGGTDVVGVIDGDVRGFVARRLGSFEPVDSATIHAVLQKEDGYGIGEIK